jgi:ferredoxin-NADP reductase
VADDAKGITFISGIANQLAHSGGHEGPVQLVLAAKHADTMQHYLDLLRPAVDAAPGTFQVAAHVTEGSLEGPEKAEESTVARRQQRPDVAALVSSAALAATSDKLSIVACGPDGFLQDVRRAVAALQLQILKGSSSLREVKLIAESYHW